MVIELRVVQFWSEIILVISNRTRAARSFIYNLGGQTKSIMVFSEVAYSICVLKIPKICVQRTPKSKYTV